LGRGAGPRVPLPVTSAAGPCPISSRPASHRLLGWPQRRTPARRTGTFLGPSPARLATPAGTPPPRGPPAYPDHPHPAAGPPPPRGPGASPDHTHRAEGPSHGRPARRPRPASAGPVPLRPGLRAGRVLARGAPDARGDPGRGPAAEGPGAGGRRGGGGDPRGG